MKGRRNRAWMDTLVLCTAAVFCIAVVLAAGYWIHTRSQPAQAEIPRLQAEGNVKTGTLNDPEGRQRELDAIVEEGMVAFSINATPSMRVGETEVNLLIENPPDNGNRFTVTINREDTGEEIYKSGYLDPEQYIEEAPLNVELPAGEYPCVANFDAYRISDNAYIGRASARITLYVQN